MLENLYQQDGSKSVYHCQQNNQHTTQVNLPKTYVASRNVNKGSPVIDEGLSQQHSISHHEKSISDSENLFYDLEPPEDFNLQ